MHGTSPIVPRLAPRRRAFTLIELLVVVAIIGLLISILLPSLRAAQEQARTAVCVANLKVIGQAMVMYFNEHDEWFPFEKRNWPESTTGNPSGFPLSAFYYGGHPGRPGKDGVASYTWSRPLLRDSFRGRAFNPYLFTNLLDRVESDAEVGTPQFEARRKTMPTYFCPSDVGGFFNNETYTDPSFTEPLHYFHGTSYDINYHFVWQWAAGSSLGGPPPYERPTSERKFYLQTANKFLKMQRTRAGAVSRFVMLYEDPFDSALFEGVQRIGWHRQWNRHSFLFLDAHAANVLANPQGRQNSGPGWKTASGAWYSDPEDPDYPYRTLKP